MCFSQPRLAQERPALLALPPRHLGHGLCCQTHQTESASAPLQKRPRRCIQLPRGSHTDQFADRSGIVCKLSSISNSCMQRWNLHAGGKHASSVRPGTADHA
jgi:hypothetical protein